MTSSMGITLLTALPKIFARVRFLGNERCFDPGSSSFLNIPIKLSASTRSSMVYLLSKPRIEAYFRNIEFEKE